MMAGHGSPPPSDRGGDASRRVHEIGEATQNPGRVAGVAKPGAAGLGRGWSNRTDYHQPYRVEGGLEPRGSLGNRTVMVSTPHRANVAVKNLAGRAAEGRDLYTGRAPSRRGVEITSSTGSVMQAGAVSPAGVEMLRASGSTVRSLSPGEESRRAAFSRAMTREKIEAEVAAGEHDDY